MLQEEYILELTQTQNIPNLLATKVILQKDAVMAEVHLELLEARTRNERRH